LYDFYGQLTILLIMEPGLTLGNNKKIEK